MTVQRFVVQARPLLVLIIGVVVGFSLSQLLRNSDCTLSTEHEHRLQLPSGRDGDGYSQPYSDEVELQAEASELRSRPSSSDNSTLAEWLFNETRVLCWVLTGPANHAKRAIHVKNTWGARCNKLLFMSSEADAELGTVKLNVGEGRGNLWQKTREASKYIYEHHFDEADWFLKADDDTYVIAENLRAFLYPFNSSAPVYFGCKFKVHVRQGYMSGGAGYVLSKEALRRFVEQAYPNPKICRQRSGGAEDKEMGTCLQNVGVVAGDSRDEFKRGRFFPSGPQSHLTPRDKSSWYWRYIFYATEDGLSCCSDYAVSFHYVQPAFFYVLDYLIYNLRPFGVAQHMPELPPKRNMTELLQLWRETESDNPL